MRILRDDTLIMSFKGASSSPARARLTPEPRSQEDRDRFRWPQRRRAPVRRILFERATLVREHLPHLRVGRSPINSPRTRFDLFMGQLTSNGRIATGSARATTMTKSAFALREGFRRHTRRAARGKTICSTPCRYLKTDGDLSGGGWRRILSFKTDWWTA